MIKLILGLYDDYEGKILVNGIDLKDIDIIHYWNHVSAVFQDFFKYETTVHENIKLDSYLKQDDIKKIDILSRIVSLENVFDDIQYTDVLGDWFDGKQLSIGQWQKIAILRCLYKEADLYVFDESDSALDEISKIKLYSGIKDEKVGKIVFVISHRFTSGEFNYDNLIILN